MLRKFAERLRTVLKTVDNEMIETEESIVAAVQEAAEIEEKLPQRYLIVGLGNPGREHEKNRHNIGFMTIDLLAKEWHISLGKVQQRAITGQGRLGEDTIILAKPQTYMNRSGDSIGPLARYYKVPPQNVLIIYDEIDIPFGSLRLRRKGGSGGHNGMKSVINHLGPDFPRIRVGVGRPPGKMPASAYVLRDFKGDDWPIVAELLDDAVAATNAFVKDGIDLAMTHHNKG